MPRSKLEFTGFDGNQLAGLLEYPDARPIAYVLFAHCFSCGKDIAAAARTARALVDRGFAVLRFDFTGIGNSDGDFANTSFSSNVQDLVLAADFLRQEYEAPQILVGHSLGGTAVLSAAGKIDECKALVTIGAPFSPEHVAKQFSADIEQIEQEGVAEVDLAGRKFRISSRFLDDIREVEVAGEVSKLKRALLVCHSPVDNTVSVSEAEKIYRTARHPKSFLGLDGADHLLTNKNDAAYLAEMIAAWASRYVQAPESETRAVEPGKVLVEELDHKFARTVMTNQHEWVADEPKKLGGRDLGPDPYEHLLASLGTCTSMTIRMYANRKNIPLDNVSVVVSHSRQHQEDCESCDESDRKLEVIEREIALEGALTEAQEARLLEIADRCPVHKTLTGNLKVY